MAIVPGNISNLSATAGATVDIFWPVNPIAGQKIILTIWTGSNNIPTSISDNGIVSSGFTLAASASDGTDWCGIYYADNITLPSSGAYGVGVVNPDTHGIYGGGRAYSGVQIGGPTNTNSDDSSSAGTSVTTGHATPDYPGALAVAVTNNDSSADPAVLSLTAAGFETTLEELNGNFWVGAGADWVNAYGPVSTAATWLIGSEIWAACIAVWDEAWSGGYARDPLAYTPGAPALAPTAVRVNNEEGAWLWAFASWRQDAGQTGTIQYPSTVTVSDDASNFWIPAATTTPAVGPPSEYRAGITRGNVSGTVSGTFSTKGTLTWATAPSAGQTILVGLWAIGSDVGLSSIASVVDNGISPTTFTLDADSVYGDNAASWIWRGNSISLPATGDYEVVFTMSGTAGVAGGGVAYTGIKPGSPTQYNGQAEAQSLVATGAVTPDAFGALYFSAVGVDSSSTSVTEDNALFTNHFQVITGEPGAVADYIAPDGPSPEQSTWTVSGTPPWASVIAVYDSIPNASIVRSAIWFAPAARTAQYVYFAPTAYQSGLVCQVFQYPEAASPWYQIQAFSSGYYIQQPYLAEVSLTPDDGVMCLAVVAWDNAQIGVAVSTTADFNSLGAESVSNGSDHFGDMVQECFYGTGGGTSVGISAASDVPADFAGLIVVISGITDMRSFPYQPPALANWPVLITEAASGASLTQDPVFADGTTYWMAIESTITAVTSPLFQPVPTAYQPVLYGSVQVVPNGTVNYPGVQSVNVSPVSPSVQYTATAWVYSEFGFGTPGAQTGIMAGIGWCNSDQVYTTNSLCFPVVVPPGEWTQLTLPPTYPVAGSSYGFIAVQAEGFDANVPVSAVFYVGYASFGPVQAYEATPPDEISWTDISSRVFTQGQIQVTRGIQYEQQSLEAGTMTVYVANNDGDITFGNVASPYWPDIGDTDVPIRLRAIWPNSVTPYVVLFSGYTDQITYGVDGGTYYGFAQIQASDAWSRLTQQMLAAVENEALMDNPVAFISCNQTPANTISSGPYSAPVQQILLTTSQVPLTTLPTASFTGGAITVAGAAGLSCWQSGGTQAADPNGNVGYLLGWFPSISLPAASGITVEFWYCPVSDYTDQPNAYICVCEALSGENTPMWQLSIENDGSLQPFFSQLYFTPFFTTGAQDTGQANYVGYLIPFYLNSTYAAGNYYIVVTFTSTEATVTVNPGDPDGFSMTATFTGLNMASECTGFTWGGDLTYYSAGASFGDTAIADIAIFDYLAPPARSASRYIAGLTAFDSDSDNYRLSRVTGYAGFVPVLGMRGTDLAVPPVADVDLVTGATDTNTQVVSAYFTNDAQSTLGALFVNGPGTLTYRRRLEWYDRPIAQYALGEGGTALAMTGQLLNTNGSFTEGITGWLLTSGTTLTAVRPSGLGPYFNYAGLWTFNGSTNGPSLFWNGPATTGAPVTPGNWYAYSALIVTPQGYPGDMYIAVNYYTGPPSVDYITADACPALPIAPQSQTYLTVTSQAPPLAAEAALGVYIDGTPLGAPAATTCTWTLGDSVPWFAVIATYAIAAGAPWIARGPSSLLTEVSSSPVGVVWLTNPAPGSTILIGVMAGAAVTSVTDNGTTQATFTADVSEGSAPLAYIYRADNITLPASGSYVVTITSTSYITAGGIAYTGVKAGAPAATNKGSATSTSVSTGSVTPSGTAAVTFAVFTDETALNPETITLTASTFSQQFVNTNGIYYAGGIADQVAPQQIYVSQVAITLLPPDYAGGPGVAVAEAPYLANYQLTSDRSQLYNYAQLTQYGTNLVSSFTGTSVLFTPTSGVVVTIENDASIALRGQVPYTVTIYLNNTSQAIPYYLNEGSMEDFGSWIVQTLGSPLMRVDQVTLNLAATPAALETALLSEIGDTITWRRRPFGAPEVQILSYLSNITHNISIDQGTWTVQQQLSPFPGGTILQCDSVIQGVLTGTNLFGW